MDHEHEQEHETTDADDNVPGMPPEDIGHFSEAKRTDGAGAAAGTAADADADDDAEEAAEESTPNRP